MDNRPNRFGPAINQACEVIGANTCSPPDATILEELARRLSNINGNLAESRSLLIGQMDRLLGSEPRPDGPKEAVRPVMPLLEEISDQMRRLESQELDLRDIIARVRRL